MSLISKAKDYWHLYIHRADKEASMTFEAAISLMKEIYRFYGLTEQDMRFIVKGAPWPRPALDGELFDLFKYHANEKQWYYMRMYQGRAQKTERIVDVEHFTFLIVSRAATQVLVKSGVSFASKREFVAKVLKQVFDYSETCALRYKREVSDQYAVPATWRNSEAP